jgi:hypothetical protein
VVDKVALGQVFSRVLRFPLPIFISTISPQSPSPIIRGWYNRPVVVAVPKVPPHKLKKKKLSPLHILLIPGSNLGLEIGYKDKLSVFLSVLQANTRIVT